VADLRRLGMDEAAIAGVVAREPLGQTRDEGGLWPENAAVAEAFLSVATQWRTAPAGPGWVAIGLDYAAVRVGLRAAGLKVTPALWSGLRVMEDAAREALNGRR
jgi:hypothetical protein